jgi:hypothetical protein
MINSPLDQRRNDRYVIDEETRNALLGIQKYWKGNTLEEHILSTLTEEDRKGSHLEKGVNFFGLFASAGVGHVCANYESSSDSDLAASEVIFWQKGQNLTL